MAVAFVRTLSPMWEKTSSATNGYVDCGGTTPVQPGNLIVAKILFDNAGTASKPVVSSIGKPTDERNSWVFLGAARSTSTTAGAFASGEIWAILATSPAGWLGGYTITLDTAVVMKACLAHEYSGCLPTLRSTVGTAYSTTTTAASAVTTGTTPVIGDLAVAFLFGSNVAAAQAGDSDTLGGNWTVSGTPGEVNGIGSTGGVASDNNFGICQHKVLTAASHQTYNNSALMTAGNGSIVAILQQAPSLRPVTGRSVNISNPLVQRSLTR